MQKTSTPLRCFALGGQLHFRDVSQQASLQQDKESRAQLEESAKCGIVGNHHVALKGPETLPGALTLDTGVVLWPARGRQSLLKGRLIPAGPQESLRFPRDPGICVTV